MCPVGLFDTLLEIFIEDFKDGVKRFTCKLIGHKWYNCPFCKGMMSWPFCMRCGHMGYTYED